MRVRGSVGKSARSHNSMGRKTAMARFHRIGHARVLSTQSFQKTLAKDIRLFL